MRDDVTAYLHGAAQQLYQASLELLGRVNGGEDVSAKEIRELAAALRELWALNETLTPAGEGGGVRVVFEGGEESWSR